VTSGFVPSAYADSSEILKVSSHCGTWAVLSRLTFSASSYYRIAEKACASVSDQPQYSTAGDYLDERRGRVRYAITVPVGFKWKAADGKWNHAIGATRDIGVAGLFVECETAPPVGCAVRVDLTLPAGPMFDTPFRLSGTAVVRYVQQEVGQTNGFGCECHFRRSDADADASTT